MEYATGPERLERLRASFAEVFENIHDTISFQEFIVLFPDPVVLKNEKILHQLYDQLLTSVEHNCQEEFELILQEHNVAALLEHVDDEKHTHKNKQHVSTAQDVEKLSSTLLLRTKKAKLEFLQQEYEKLRQENATIADELVELRKTVTRKSEDLVQPKMFDEAAAQSDETMSKSFKTELQEWVVALNQEPLAD
eukprot:m.198014 g.198014  ORF g.198014 m.198014 type:complete len:194 (+) comp25887_c0_seq6:46-627(+)